MSEGDPLYRPPQSELHGSAEAPPAGVVRTLLAALAGFALDVALSEFLRSVQQFVFVVVERSNDYVGMDFRAWAASLTNPWAALDLLVSTLMSILGGYVAARIARGREWRMFALLASLHLIYTALPDLPRAEDMGVFVQISIVNVGAAFAGVWLRQREKLRDRKTGEQAS